MLLWEILGSSFEAHGAVILLCHFEDSYAVSVGQPGDKRPVEKRRKSVKEAALVSEDYLTITLAVYSALKRYWSTY